MRMMLFAALVSGCGAPAKHTRRGAELAIGDSLVGMAASGVALAVLPPPEGEPGTTSTPVEIPLMIGFGVVAVASTIVYVVADMRVNE